MSEHVDWTGKSGTSYTFVVIPWPAPLKEGYVEGNYICARQAADGEWIPVYIGEGDLASPHVERRKLFDLLQKRGVTHVHCHLNNDADARRQEAQDLMERHTLAGSSVATSDSQA